MSGRSLPRAWAVASLVLCVSMVIGQAPVSGQQRRTDGLPSVARNVMYVSQPTGRRAVEGHVTQEDIESHRWTIRQLRLAGERLFLAQFTRHDGAGRPGATGDASPTRRPIGSGRDFLRTAGPDANSCFSCHNMPSVGGAGAFTANVFAGLGSVHPLAFSVDPGLSSERGTPELHGSSAIELLAREMTQDLHGLREAALALAPEEGELLLRRGAQLRVIDKLVFGPDA